MNSFIIEHSIFLMIAILTLSLTVILHTKKAFFIQLVFLLIFLIIGESLVNLFYIAVTGLQVIFGLIVVYRLKKAIDRNYLLVLEKTLKIPRYYTRDGQSGSQSSFFEA